MTTAAATEYILVLILTFLSFFGIIGFILTFMMCMSLVSSGSLYTNDPFGLFTRIFIPWLHTKPCKRLPEKSVLIPLLPLTFAFGILFLAFSCTTGKPVIGFNQCVVMLSCFISGFMNLKTEKVYSVVIAFAILVASLGASYFSDALILSAISMLCHVMGTQFQGILRYIPHDFL